MKFSKAVAAGGSVGAYFKTATYTYDSSDVATASKVTVTLEFKEGSDLDQKNIRLNHLISPQRSQRLLLLRN